VTSQQRRGSRSSTVDSDQLVAVGLELQKCPRAAQTAGGVAPGQDEQVPAQEEPILDRWPRVRPGVSNDEEDTTMEDPR
jgi:hypothetical protein